MGNVQEAEGRLTLELGDKGEPCEMSFGIVLVVYPLSKIRH